MRWHSDGSKNSLSCWTPKERTTGRSTGRQELLGTAHAQQVGWMWWSPLSIPVDWLMSLAYRLWGLGATPSCVVFGSGKIWGMFVIQRVKTYEMTGAWTDLAVWENTPFCVVCLMAIYWQNKLRNRHGYPESVLPLGPMTSLLSHNLVCPYKHPAVDYHSLNVMGLQSLHL